MNTLYIECKMGAAGDMLNAALYELLNDEQKKNYVDTMNGLFGKDLAVTPEKKAQCGIWGTHMKVVALGKEEMPGEDGHEYHEHEHMHGHEGEHEHESPHNHEHEHEHEHDHDHDHMCEHDGGHMHEHEHFHEHEHEHACDHEACEHMHDHDHMHDHMHEHEHEHPHESEHTHDHHHHGHAHYSYASLAAKISDLPLPDAVKQKAAEVYRLIGDAEAHVHNSTLEQIHFHEVGSMDALCDVVGACLLFSYLNPEQILVSPIHVGNGTVHCAHGILPVPAPATAEILKGVPYYTGSINTELCTPTGAAILKAFADGFCQQPVMTIREIGIGLGTKEFSSANMVRIFQGDSEPQNKALSDEIAEISCNIDDMTGEELGFVMDFLLKEGALDVFYESIQMKKNRPGVMLKVFCPPEKQQDFARLILKNTSTRGVRFAAYKRMKLDTRFENLETPFGTVRRKINSGYGVEKSKYEYEDLRKIAVEQGMSLEEVRRLL